MQVTACDNILYVEMFTLIVTQHTYKLYNIYINGKQKKNLYSTLPVHKTQKKKKKNCQLAIHSTSRTLADRSRLPWLEIILK